MRLNANYGVVRSISKDKTTITISLPLGGSIQCKNAGFEIGQEVCFITNALRTRVVKVLPKDIADLTVLLGTDKLLQEAIQKERPQTLEIPELEEIEREEEDYEHYDDAYYRSLSEEYLDCLSEETGENDTEWELNF